MKLPNKNYTLSRIEEQTPPAVACDMINNYLRDNSKHVYTEIGGSVLLENFVFNRQQIDRIIDQENVLSIFLKFGYHLDQSHGNSRKGYTIIAIGLDDTGNLQIGDNDLFSNPLVNNGDYISKATLTTLVANYRNGKTINHTHNPVENPSELKGHSFPITEFKQFPIEDVQKFQFVLTYHYTPSYDHLQTGYTWLLYGLDKNGIRIQNPVFDFCEPCPKICPKNVDSI